jgi:RNA polymerase sigma-70 factor (ECF subfamily)
VVKFIARLLSDYIAEVLMQKEIELADRLPIEKRTDHESVYSRLSERELIEQAKHDPEAFGILYDRNYSAILNYCIRRTGDIELAHDITSETFVKALKNIARFEWRDVSFSAWLYRIAGNEIASYFRKKTYKAVSLDHLSESQGLEPVSPHELEEEFIEAQEELERHKEFLAIREQAAKLPLKYQDVIALRYYTNKNIKEIADILEKPEGTIKSLLHRGLEKLKNQLSGMRKT